MRIYTNNQPLQWCIEHAKASRCGSFRSFFGTLKAGMRKSIEKHLGTMPGCTYTETDNVRTYTISSGSAALCVVSDDTKNRIFVTLSDWRATA